SPFLARFISRDPIGFAGSTTNLYEYAGGNPVDFTDPTGMFGFPGSIVGGAAVAGLEGAIVNVGINGAIAVLSGRKYSSNDAANDAMSGFVTGALLGALSSALGAEGGARMGEGPKLPGGDPYRQPSPRPSYPPNQPYYPGY